MTDYTTPSGAGQLMVRDQGSVVEFWVYAGYNLQWNNLRFSVDANGTTSYFSVNYHGTRIWVQVGSLTINNSQDINFNLLDRTGISSIQGPTTLSVHLERGQPPGQPGDPSITGVSSNAISVHFNDGGDGGRPIDIRQIGWGTDPGGPQRTDWIPVDYTFGGLQKGTTYYFWAQTHNDKGWSPWSGRNQATTQREPFAPQPAALGEPKQTSFRYQFLGGPDGGSPIREWQIGYGTDPNYPNQFVSSGGDSTVGGLQPATMYYVWCRGRNDVGWGDWSFRANIRTIAGAYVSVGLTVHEAIPYVKANGVWMLAQPWIKQAGNWKETQ